MARGIPNNPVVCRKCQDPHGCPKDRLCHRCRIQEKPNPNKRYHWTSNLDLALKRAYQGASTRRELSRNLDQLQLRTGFTRVVILARAATLGFGARRRRWTAEEIVALTKAAGRLSDIARRLSGSYRSIKSEFSRLDLRSHVIDGYSQTDVACLLGASERSVRKWISLGWLKLQHSRVTEASLIRFIRTQPEEYQLSRVDEAWFKGVLFSAFGRKYTNGLGSRANLANKAIENRC
jgi:hypothetical protein